MAHPPEYLSFLRAWLDFAEDPSNNPHCFSARQGLCFNTLLWDICSEESIEGYLSDRLDIVCRDSITPFNTYPNSFTREQDKTKNPKRLAFVRKELGL